LIAQSLVRHALAALPPRRRAILILYELEGATIPAIAKLVGVTPVTVRWHLSIGRREMARTLGKGTQ
jgi:DNA-directed RNA polymerase specialized sigma24 family protein